jgi:hypothetical protein
MIGSILLLSDTEMIRIFAGAASALPLRFPLPVPSRSLVSFLGWRSASRMS